MADPLDTAATATEWLPHAYMDEDVPPTRRSPDAWLARTSAGAWAIADPDAPEGCDPVSTLQEGEVVLFDYRVDLAAGRLIVTVDDDHDLHWHTSFRAPTTAPPGTEMSVWGYQEGQLWPSLAEAAEELGAGEHEVAVYAWSHPAIAFRFIGGRFERVRQDG